MEFNKIPAIDLNETQLKTGHWNVIDKISKKRINLTTKTEKLTNGIVDISSSLTKSSSGSTLTKSKMLELEALILKEKLNISEEKAILSYDEVKGALPRLQHFYEVFETNLEEEFVNDFLNGRKELRDYLLYNRFVKLITNEKNLAKISKKDCVLFIGSGPLPITAILLNKFTKCSVDCYDKNNIFANISKRVIENLSLSDKIKIYNGKGEDLSGKKYSVIIIALLAKPKDKILQNIWNESIKGTKVICRTTDGIREAFYEKTTPNLFIKYTCTNKVFAKHDQTISSALLIK
ncbi:MAG: nicotianamine synthase family protein [archaeon]